MAMGINFFLDAIFASVSLACMILLFVYLAYRAPDVRWGDVSQSLLFHTIRKYLLQLQAGGHNKLWRPSILLLLDDLDCTLVDFCNTLKKGGLYVIGNVIVSKNFTGTAAIAQKQQNTWRQFINKAGIKAFAKTAVAPTIRLGYQNLMMMGGLGAMEPNTVVLPLIDAPNKDINTGMRKDLKDFIERRRKNRPASLIDIFADPREASLGLPDFNKPKSARGKFSMDVSEFLWILRDVLATNKNIVVTENFEEFDCDLLNSSALQKYILGNRPSDHRPGVNREKADVELESVVSKESEAKADAPEKTPYKRVDVWIDCNKYSWSLEMSYKDSGAPALMMQLAFITTQNARFARMSRLRVLLLTNKPEEDEARFRETLQLLRLDGRVDEIICLPRVNISRLSWTDLAVMDEVWRMHAPPGLPHISERKQSSTPKPGASGGLGGRQTLGVPQSLSSYESSSTVPQPRLKPIVPLQTTAPPSLAAKPENRTPLLHGKKTQILEASEQMQARSRANQMVDDWRQLNKLIRANSQDTYMTFFALPEIPPPRDDLALDEQMAHIWLNHMLVLTKDLPSPIAFVQTGEKDPVISTAM